MNKISLLVVLYNKKISDSQTLLSLLNSESQVIDNLSIWNNGPHKIDADHRFCQLQEKINHVVLINDLSNRPLSKIYNSFIHTYPESHYFVIFDDDSILETSYLTLLKQLKSENEINLYLPKIVQHQKVHYPLKELKPIVDGDRLTPKNCRSISSGLIFDQTLVNAYQQQFSRTIFDEKFALYGVDTSFFFRLAKLEKPLSIKSEGEISHSLSRLNRQDKQESKFRVYERAIDVALCARHYPSWNTYKAFIKYLLKSVIKSRDPALFWLLIKSYILAIHPNCQ